MTGNLDPNNNPNRFTTPVSRDDYIRLGIGVEESRVSVIRKAATAATAAIKQKNQPEDTERSDEQLAEIATSTYRILDPRGRSELMQRVQLLRVESSPIAVAPWWKYQRTPKTSDSVRDRFDPSAAHVTYTPKHRAYPMLDILRDRIADRLKEPRVLVITASIMMIVLICFTLMVVSISNQPVAEDLAPQDSTPVAIPLSDQQPSEQSDEPNEYAPVIDPEPEQLPPPPSSPSPPNPFAQVFTADNDNSAGAIGETDNDPQDPNRPGIDLISPSEVEHGFATVDPESVPQTIVNATEDLNPANPITPGPAPQADTTPVQQAPPPSAPTANIDRRHEIPSPAELQAATESLQRLIAALPEAASDNEAIDNIRKLGRTATDSPEGSADRYVLLLEITRRLIVIGMLEDAERSKGVITDQYKVGQLAVYQHVLKSISKERLTLAQKERVLWWAMRTGEHALTKAQFEAAAESTRLATTLAIQMGDNDLRSQIKQLSEAIRSAKRMLSTVEKSAHLDSSAVSSTSANLIGRYYCFYLRDWEAGLPYLAKSSSVKLASMAKTELQKDHDALMLIGRWETIAEDQRGRIRESILFHARDLALGALEGANGLAAEDYRQLITKLEAKLPKNLPAGPTKPLAQQAPDVPQGVNEYDGMLGRLSADGIDVGALIYYKPGLGLTREAFSQILDQLKVAANKITLDFVGIVELRKNSTIKFTAAGLGQNDAVTIDVNGNPLAIAHDADLDRYVAAQDLPAGMHIVRWQFGGTNLKTCFLKLEDDRENKVLSLRHSPALLQQVTGDRPPRLRVRLLNINQ